MDDNKHETIFYAGIILFNPENSLYLNSIKVLLSLGVKIVVFDNSTTFADLVTNEKLIFEAFGGEVVFLKSEKGNVGLGYPFNEIVKIAIKEGNCKGIYFFDQDSEVNSEAILNLEKSFEKLSSRQQQFGIIAALAMRKEGMPYRIRIRSIVAETDPNLIEVDQVPSSFSLIPMSTFKKIGFFYEDFFIDHIDMDFSMRCWINNLPVFIDTNAKFIHGIGIGDVKIFNKYLFPFSDEYRHYYQIRNHVLSLKRNKISYLIILKEVFIRIMVVTVISIYAGKFFKRFKYLFKGIYDGFNNISGKLIVKE